MEDHNISYNITMVELPKDAWTCVNIHSITSNGLFKSDIDPLYYTSPIFLMQSSLATCMTCIMSALFLPLGIPAMVTQLLAGISLGPSMLGHIKDFQSYIFPPRSYIPLRTFGNIGTILQMFLIGLQMDPANFKPGKKGLVIGIWVVIVPITLNTLFTLPLYINQPRDLVDNIENVGKLQSLNSFPVIAGYLIELNILNTEFSNFAFCTSMVSGTIGSIIVWDMLSYKITETYTNGAGVAVIATLAIVAVVTVVLLKTASWSIIRITPDGKQGGRHLNIILLLVLLTAYLGSRGNVHFLFPPFLAGLVIPPGTPLGTALIEKISFYHKWMVMPVFYLAHGITMTDISEVPPSTIFLYIYVTIISSVGKFLGAFIPAVYYKMSYKDASLLGLTMNAQGFLEVVAFTYFKDLEMIKNESLSILLVTMVIMTGASAPLVRYLYNTSLKYKLIKMRTIQHTEPNCELRILGCVYEDENVRSMIDVLTATNATTESPIKFIIIHFVELVGRTTPLIISHKVHKILPPAAAVSEPIVNVFKYYEETNKERFAVHPYTVVSNYASMYNDLLALALNRRAALILLPYHKSSATGYVNPGIRKVNYYVLEKSPCSVGILIDRGLHNSAKFLYTSWESYRVAVIFFGGADDREALAYAKRMSEDPAIELTVFQFHPSTENGSDSIERSLDDEMFEDFKLETASNNQVRYIDEEVDEGLGVIEVINSIKNKYELILIGRRHDENLPLILELTDWNKCSELGTIADIFITSGYGGNATLLVIQQQSKVGASSLFREDGKSKAIYDVDRGQSSFRLETISSSCACACKLATTTAEVPSPNIQAMADNTTIIELPKDAWTCVDIHSITSNGLFKSDISPLYYTNPIFLLQSSLAMFMACITASIFMPLGIPAMITQLMAGILLGPTMLGHIKNFPRDIFPPRSYVPLRAYGNFGTLLQMFVIALQLDPTAVFKPGKKGVVIGLSVIIVPVALTSLCAMVLEKSIIDETGKMSSYLAVVGKVESLTSFPVIAGYLIELNILNTEFSNIAFCASMISSIVGSVLVGGIMADEQRENYSIGAVVAVLVIYAIVAVVIVVLIAPTVRWIIKKTPDGHLMKPEHLNDVISLLFLTVFLSYQGNIQMLFAPLVAGLIVPPGPPLGSVIIEKLDFFNTWMVMPIFYAVHGITMADIFQVPSRTTSLVVLVILASFVGKFLGAFLPAVFFKMSCKDATLLGLTMNAQGFLELLIFTYLKDHEMIDRECFTTLCVSMIIITGASAPLVRYVYKNSMKYKLHHNRTIQHTGPNSELRVLGCVYDEENVAPMIHVLKATNPTVVNPIYLSIIHFVELVGRLRPTIIAHKMHKKLPVAAAVSQHIVNAFKHYEESNKENISVNPYTVVSYYPSMHNDVCKLAFQERTSFIILPYHKNLATCAINPGIRKVNYYVLEKSPCSVGILIDRGVHNSAKFLYTSWESYHVAVIFFGGADDREALAYAKRMSEHPAIELTVFQFHPSTENGSDSTERSLDEAMIEDFKLETASKNQVRYIEEKVDEGLGVIEVINSIENKYELILIGRRHDENLPLIVELTDWNKCSELGTIADIFITSGYGGNATLLVIQQQSKEGARSLFRQDAELNSARYDVDREANSFGSENYSAQS